MVCKKLPPLVDPDIARDFIYIDDVVSAFIAIASSKTHQPGSVYNVGTGKQTTLADVVNLARNIFAISEEPKWGSMPNRKWDSSIWIADISKISETLDWRPLYTFKDGLLQTVASIPTLGAVSC